jgi:hypothetical protein
VCGCVKRVALSAKGAAISSGQAVLFDQQYLQPGPHQQIGANQAADTRANNNRVVGIVRFVAKTSEAPGQEILLARAGRLQGHLLENAASWATNLDKTVARICAGKDEEGG